MMDIESCANRIWEVVLDSYGTNVDFTDDEVVVYQSAWEEEMKVRIRAILEEALKDYHYIPRGYHDVEEFYLDEERR